MKQIDEGIDLKTRPWKGDCHACQAVFESTGEEMNRLVPGCLHFSIIGVATTDCPECGGRKKVHMSPRYVRPPAKEREDAEELAMWASYAEPTVPDSKEIITIIFDHATGKLETYSNRDEPTPLP